MVKVGAFPNPPSIFQEKSSQAAGIFPEILEVIAKEEGWELEYYWADWDELLQMTMAGDLDILPSIAYSRERDHFLDFNEETILTNWATFYILEEMQNIFASTVDLEGLKIAVVEDSIQRSALLESKAELNLDIQILDFPTFQSALEAVRDGEADGAMVNALNGRYLESEVGGVQQTDFVFHPVRVHYATQQGENTEILDRIDFHLRGMKEDPESVYSRAHSRWVDPLLHPEKKVLGLLPWVLGGFFGILLLLILFRWQLGIRTRELREQVRKAKELATDLKKSRKQLEIATGAGNIGLWSWQTKTGAVVFNQEWAGLLGYTLEELEPLSFETWRDLCHEKDLENVEELLRRCFLGERTTFQGEVRMRHKQGHWVWILSRGRVMEKNEEGEPTLVMGAHTDINAIKEAEQSLKKDEFILNSIPHPVWLRNPQGALFYSNQEASSSFGISGRQRNRISWKQVIHPDDYEYAGHQWHKAKATKSGYKIELRLFNRTTQCFRWNLILIEPMLDENGEIEQWVSIATDIHSFMLSQKRLIQARDKAEKANRIKSEFLAVMNHELRTPLNSILAPIRLLQEKISDPGQRKLLKFVDESADHLLHLINDILDLSKAEQGFLKAKPETVNIRELLPRRLGPLQREAESKGLQFSISLDSKLPDYLLLDERMLVQILINLVGNAVKFTAGGLIHLVVNYVDAIESSAPKGRLEILVEDTGPGIEEEFFETIFEPFRQTDMSLDREFEGTGLGLAISRQMAMALAGVLELKSSSKSGSVFRLSIPVTVSSSPDNHSRESQSLLKKEVKTFFSENAFSSLIVDDDPATIQVLNLLLKPFHLHGKSASSGEEAVDLLQEHPFHIVFMDIQLPGMDGFETTTTIRRMLKNASPYFIAITAFSDVEDPRFQEANFEDYINKPITIEDLTRALHRFHQKAQQARPVDQHSPRS